MLAALGGYHLASYYIPDPLEAPISWEILQPVYSAANFLFYMMLLRLIGRPWDISSAASLLMVLADTLLSSISMVSIALGSLTDNQIWQRLLQIASPFSSVILYAGLLFLFQKMFHLKQFPKKGKVYPLLLLLPVLCLVLFINISIEQTVSMEVEGSRIFVFYGRQEAITWETVLRITCLTALAYVFSAGNLYFMGKLMDAYEADRANALLRQQLAVQESYAREAGLRYQHTQSLRHDLKNHVTVLRGLLDKGEIPAASAYLNQLEQSAEAISFPVETGRPAVNIILGEKLSLARQQGIHTIYDVAIPSNMNVSDFDLCVMLSNALDNAITACLKAEEGSRSIDIKARKNNGFFLIDIINTTDEGKYTPVLFGTGLENIRATAEKYGGTISVERGGKTFTLTILLACL